MPWPTFFMTIYVSQPIQQPLAADGRVEPDLLDFGSERGETPHASQDPGDWARFTRPGSLAQIFENSPG